MKKRIVMLATIACLATTTVYAETYPETGIVTEIKYDGDICCYLLEIITANGNLFSCYVEDGDWSINDIVSMQMNSVGSELVEDHEIIKIKYSGTLEQLAQWAK